MLRTFASLSLALVFWIHSGPPAHAMSCDNRGAADRLHFGSNVSGEQVTICAEYWWPPSPQKKAPPPKKPTTPSKVVPNFFVVTPAKPRAFTADSSVLSIGQSFSVATSATTHVLKNTLLGRLALVSFRPTKTIWHFGDGGRTSTPRPSHAFFAAGTFKVYAVVTYAVKFRFVGTTRWFSDPRGIAIKTNALRFRVSQKPSIRQAGKPLLVLYDCLGGFRIGC